MGVVARAKAVLSRLDGWSEGLQGRVAGWRRRTLATVLVCGVAAGVMLSELDRLVAGSITAEGRTAAARAALGPSPGSAGDTWQTWGALGSGVDDVALWLACCGVMGLLLAAALTVLLMRVAGVTPLGRRLVAVLGLALVAQHTVLVVLAGVLAWRGGVGWGATGLALLSLVAWVSAAVLAVTVVRSDALRAAVRVGWRRLATALRYQRLSAVPVLLLAVASTASGPNILDQVPDVERSWVNGARGPRDAFVGLVSVLVVSLLLLAVGRRRARRAATTYGPQATPADEPPSRGRWLVWLVVPGLALVVAAGLALWGPDDTVSWRLVGLTVLVPALLIGLSLPIHDATWLWTQPSPDPDPDLVVLTRQLGDLLAVGLLSVLGLGLVRSFTAPVFASVSVPRDTGEVLPLVGVLAAALVLVVASIPLGLKAISALDPPTGAAQPGLRAMIVTPGAQLAAAPAWVRRLPGALCVVAPSVLLAALLLPADLGDALGVFGLVTLVLGAWVALLSLLVVYLQDSRPLPVFRLLHLRASPVLTLFVAVPALAALAPSQPELHHVRTLGTAPASQVRLVLAEAFDAWVADPSPCVVEAAPGVRVRPLLVLAASGGGIRSAYWTASVVDRLGRSGDCGRDVTLLSSGVSGGAVGLVVSRQAWAQSPVEAVRAMARPRALAAGLSGTLVGDLVGGSVGLRVPPLRDGDEPARWLDRAGLMERAWERAVPELSEPWEAQTRGTAGALVLNSTDARSGCRVLVSQVALRLETSVDGLEDLDHASNCRARTGLPAATLDLFDTYGDCSPRLAWSTAAMMAARFPTVTPAGRVPRRGGCEAKTPDVQLVDGGYAESSGVGTLAELAPQLAGLVQAHNARVPAGQAFVVPLVAYLEDEVRSDVVARPPGEAPELFVPLAGTKAKAQQSVTASQLQRVAGAFAHPCPGRAGDPCARAVAEVHRRVPDGALLVGPSLEPTVTAPLGWTLSHESMTQLDRALEREARRRHARPGAYATLGALLALLGAQ